MAYPVNYKGMDIHAVKSRWPESKGQAVRIAVVDTGMPEHDLLSQVVFGTNVTNEPDHDLHGHATSLCGVIQAMAPEAEIVAVKTSTANGSSTMEAAIKGINWCTENDIQIISISWGSHYRWPPLNEAIQRAVDSGIVVVASAGNDDGGPIQWPARYEPVVAVGSIRKDLEGNIITSAFSNKGPELDFMGLGQHVVCPKWDPPYTHHVQQRSGCSIAAPQIAAMLALVWHESDDPIQELKDLCFDLGPIGWDEKTGWGIPIFEKIKNKIDWVKKPLKSKTVWTGIGALITGIINRDPILIINGLGLIFLRMGISKTGGVNDKDRNN